MDHAADAQRINLMTITRFVLNERSKHPESRGDFTNLLSHIVTCCWELLLDSLYLLAKPTCRYFVSTNLRAKNKRNWMCFQMSFSSRPWSSVAEHASLSLKGIKRQILLSHRCVEGTVSFLIHRMNPLTLTVVFPLNDLWNLFGERWWRINFG